MKNKGSLTFPEFALAMYLTSQAIQKKEVPKQLPSSLRDEVVRAMNAPGGLVRPFDSGSSSNTMNTMGSFGSSLNLAPVMPTPQPPPPPPPPPSSMGQLPPMGSALSMPMQNINTQPQLPLNSMHQQVNMNGPGIGQQFMPASQQNLNVPWAVTPEEKAAYDQVFTAWDTRGTGFIAGETARAIFSQSGLDQSSLAKIWELADINNHGKLNADEFAVAMHLVHRALAGHPIPYRLTPDLIPPSTRVLAASVDALKNSLVQDIVQQRHISAAYSGTRFAGTSGIGISGHGTNGSNRDRSRDKDADWDSVYRPPRMGDVRRLDDDDLYDDIESSGYRSVNRRKPVQKRRVDDPWANLRSTAERYGTPSYASADRNATTDTESALERHVDSGSASKETIAELRKQLGEQRILLEALSYSAGDPDAQYVTDEERKARDEMREVALKIRELEKRISIAEGQTKSEVSTNIVGDMDLSRFKPEAMKDQDTGAGSATPPASTSAKTTTASIKIEGPTSADVDAVISATRMHTSPPSSSIVSPPASTSSVGANKSDPDAIKNRAAELLAQRMAALTGKTLPLPGSPKPATEEKPKETAIEEPAKPDPMTTMSSRLAAAKTKEERQAIIQEEAERRMKERQKFLRETMGGRPTSVTSASSVESST
jgi:hypothetical protein